MSLGETSSLPGKIALPFYLAILGMALLYTTLWRFEMAAKNTRSQLHAIRRKLGDDVVLGRSAAPR